MAILPIDSHFLLPKSVTPEQFIADLTARPALLQVLRQTCEKNYYDSFDWRLYAADMACAAMQEGQVLRFFIIDLKSGNLLCETVVPTMPVFAGDMADPTVREMLTPVLEMRALLPVLTQILTCYDWHILDKRQKTVARLRIETYESQTFVHLLPLRGFSKALSKWSEILQADFGLLPITPLACLEPLLQQRERNGAYTHKLDYGIEASMRADVAGKQILGRLADVIKNNEQGVIADIDSEFLHDFRVAIRKTRAALGQLKGIFPAWEVQAFRDYFAWLGQITGSCRDLDVYLLNFADYKNSLPAAVREDLNPLQTFLREKHRQTQQELAKHLRSRRYAEGFANWQRFLRQEPDASDADAVPPNAALPIKVFAAQSIWRVYRRVLRQGGAIDDASPPEELHEVRKTCKKLRYLLEFFQSLFPSEDILVLIKSLKAFQEVLGSFQDCQVQEERLKHFSEEMLESDIPAATFLAMGVLIQHLDELRCQARADFAQRFAEFQSAGHREAYAALFAPIT